MERPEFRFNPRIGEPTSDLPERQELKLDPTIGKLLQVSRQTVQSNNHVSLGLAEGGFFGGCFRVPPTEDEIVIIPRSRDKERVCVKTMHISCQSDTYQPGHNYGGVIIYQYNGKSDWRTANGTHCKSGYIVIQDTDSENVKRWMNEEPGAVHGAVYRNAFGESVNNAEVVGEGFAIRNNEKLEINSSVFNNPPNSVFHDFDRRMHKFSEHCVRKVVEYWMTAGPCWVRQGNFEVKQLLEDLDIKMDKLTLY